MKMDYNEGGTYVVLGRNVILSSDKQVEWTMKIVTSAKIMYYFTSAKHRR